MDAKTSSALIELGSPSLGEPEKRALCAVIDDGWLTMGERVRQFERRMVGCDQDARAEAHALCGGRGPAQGHQRVVEERRRIVLLGRMDEMIADPHIGETQLFRVLRGAGDRVRAGGFAVLREMDADAHADTLRVERGHHRGHHLERGARHRPVRHLE